ncbi:multidrug Oligosaccharidyl-lipid polysaccharide flippase [Clavulina sp. PMI_390]|nr:multidrug Oligosaccharidyl-lipid polysaccharide flippase [Clavulina sp. PMI_390]
MTARTSKSPAETEPLLSAPSTVAESDSDDVADTIHESAEGWQLWLQELKIIAKYTAPVFGTHVLEYSLSMASVISIGHLSTNHLAAVTLGTMTSSVTGLSVILGFVSALDSLLPQAWTSSNPSLVGLWSQRMMLLVTMLLVPIFMIWFNAEPILIALQQEPEIAHLAGVYLKWLSLGLPAYAFNSVARRYLQSIGLMHVPTYIVIFVAPINILLNWLLVWGPPSIRLGYIGAPISTACSFNLISLLTLTYALVYSPREAWQAPSSKVWKSLGSLMQLGSAGVGQIAAEWWSWELVGRESQLGPVALASQSVLLVSASTSYQAPFALSVASSVRIGNNLGAGHAIRAEVATKISIYMALVISLFFSTIFMVFRHDWAYIFNDDNDVVVLVAKIMPIVAVFQIFDGLCAVTAGILRSRGRQSLGALLNFVSYYIIGLFLTFRMQLELYGLWIGLAVALLVGGVASVIIVLHTDWQHEIERVQARLAGDRDDVKIPTIVEECDTV